MDEINETLKRIGGWGSVYIPEFTYGCYRIDAAIIDMRTRWIRGFEIKRSRGDFLRDEKWQHYSQFCSSLSIACPWGLINKWEIDDPFGLLWIKSDAVKWEKKPKRFQRRDGLAWLYTYVEVLEKEFPRVTGELDAARRQLKYYESESYRLAAATTVKV